MVAVRLAWVRRLYPCRPSSDADYPVTVTLLGVLNINVATQNIVKGGMIILVLALAGSRKTA